MLKNKKIDHINLQVPDLEQAIQWYKEELGFTMEGHFKSPYMEMCYLKSNEGVIYEIVEARGASKTLIEHIAYVSDDIQKDFEYCKNNGYSMLNSEVGYIDFLWEKGVYYFMVITPNNEKIEFCQKK